MTESVPKHTYHYVIDAHGQWICEGNPVVNGDLFCLLSRSLFIQEGRHFVRCEGETHPVEVADAPLMVRYVHVRADDPPGNLTEVEIELEDGRREPLAADTLIVTREDALYCLATPRRLRARFGKTAYYELARYIETDENTGLFTLTIGDRLFPIHTESPPLDK